MKHAEAVYSKLVKSKVTKGGRENEGGMDELCE